MPLANTAGPIDRLALAVLVSPGSLRPVVIETSAGELAVPRHPFRKQDCEFSVYAFLLTLGARSVGALVAVWQLPGYVSGCGPAESTVMIDKFKYGPAVLPGAVLPLLNRGSVADSVVGHALDAGTPFIIALALLANAAKALQCGPGNGPVGTAGRLGAALVTAAAAMKTGIEVGPKSANPLVASGNGQADRLSG